MGSGTSDTPRSISVDNAARRAGFYTTWSTVIFVLTFLILVGGKAIPFISENSFLTFLGFWFMLIATVGYRQSHKASADLARKTGEQGVQRTNWGMLFLGVFSAVTSAACVVSLIVT